MAPLSGIRVLDLADERAVFATRILADLGADVIRVEPPDGGRVRRLAPFLNDEPGTERGFYHLYHNANKRSVVLDWRTRPGAEQLRHLAADADVLVETEPPGSLASLGLDYDALRHLNPGLIYVSVTPFGQTGPRRSWKANDLVATAAGGLAAVSGDPGGPPEQPGADQAYKLAGLAAATGIVALVLGRNASLQSPGAHLDISLQECVAMAVVQTSNANRYAWQGTIPRRPGMNGVVQRCADGRWTTLNVRPDRFAPFLEWVREAGIETDLAPTDWQIVRQDIAAGGGPVTDLVARLAASMPRDELLARAWKLDLVGMPVNTFAEMLTSDHLVETRQFLTSFHLPLDANLGFSRSPVDAIGPDLPLRRAPLLGEHTQEIMGAARGLERRQGKSAAVGPPDLPLTGVRVLDFSWVLAGPLGTRLLANLGADVIRIESRTRLDGARVGMLPPGVSSVDVAPMYNDVNTGKRSVSLDLSHPEARALVLRLAQVADVVTNNYRPGTMERLGLGHEELSAANPELIVLNLPGQGPSGPWSQHGAFGHLIQAAGGLSFLGGFPQDPPHGLGVAYADFVSPFALATVALAALRERRTTGRGRQLDVSQLSVLISLLGVEWMQFIASGTLPSRRQNRDANYCPHGIYPATGEDQWVALAVDGDDEWERFCSVIERQELAGDPRLAGNAGRKQHEDELDEAVRGWTRSRDRWEIAALLQEHGIAAAPVENLRDMLELDTQLAGHYQRVRQPSEPDVEIIIDGDPIRFAARERTLIRAPMLGEHNEAVLCGLLGLPEDDFDALVVAGVIN